MGTGHGDTNGDWCFPQGRISFASLSKLHNDNHTGWVPRIYSDCCHSGNWAHKGVSHGWHVVCASDSTKQAYNRTFAKAVFKGDPDAQHTLYHTCAAVAT